MSFILSKGVFAAAALLIGTVSSVLAQSAKEDESYHADYIFGAPAEASEAWIMSRGGRLYDNWYAALGADEPEATHPAWPDSNTKKKGAVTTRCKSCHGWDYRGAEGKYGSGSYKTGILGVMAYSGRDVAKIIALLRGDAHGYTTEMIPPKAWRCSRRLAPPATDLTAAPWIGVMQTSPVMSEPRQMPIHGKPCTKSGTATPESR